MWWSKPKVKIIKHRPNTKYQRMLMIFKSQGKVTNIELNKICFRYGAHIYGMRKEGYTIVTHRLNNSLYEYIFKGRKS